MPRAGRKPKPEGERRSYPVRMYLNQREYAALVKASKPGEALSQTAIRILFYDEPEGSS